MMYDHVDKNSAELNIDFLKNYAHFNMNKRNPLDNLLLDEHKIKSGDLFGIIRLDGLDPILAYYMGSTTGHNTMAMWLDNELYVVESTVESIYWPTDGIQKTPYKLWLKQAEDAGFNVVHVPLNTESRKKWNDKNAVNFFNNVVGFEYGYINMFWSAVDTLFNSYPCIPSDFSTVCFQFEFVETLFAIIDRVAPETSDLMWNLAYNKRLGTSNLRTAEIYYEAFKQGYESRELPAMVEKDSWTYNTTRNGIPTEGPSMMCCVFVCRMWKAAGIFDDLDFNCAELTDVDVYSLTVLDNNYTQILGKYTLELNRFQSRTPYAHMGETCASMAPEYNHEPNC